MLFRVAMIASDTLYGLLPVRLRRELTAPAQPIAKKAGARIVVATNAVDSTNQAAAAVIGTNRFVERVLNWFRVAMIASDSFYGATPIRLRSEILSSYSPLPIFLNDRTPAPN